MEKEGNYMENFPGLDYEQQQDSINQEMGAIPLLSSSNFCGSNSFDKLSFADVMQFADFGPKLGLNQGKAPEEEDGFFLKLQQDDDESHHRISLMASQEREEQGGGEKSTQGEGKSKRKRPRTSKTVEEVESQRMTHIAVERNRRKQMNEHLRVLRSLMPSSYVQRGDQASIIGGAIEFVRELEQLLQCLESQKRRRLYGDGARPAGDPSTAVQQQQQPQMLAIPSDEETAGLREETAESKSFLADVEVKLLGFDALIKILSRRRHGQLIQTIAALEDLQLTILHTNITTIEQTVLYSFNIKINGEARFTAEDLANSVQQIFSFIHANNGI
ncbi:transcription factor FAMA isoform X2 [Salvia hispanica]|uniref:transcription factor FAMA isoform X2 n=1 Tax=Salvia hispanica TaxID=49212 RepID=UPI002009D135|nr:transcription factor FAMA isoform X2 [Salvia hispanica]XP_047977872.1 transcription factor FAMA isoform X2 [Salvia hispanica]